jgi:two-component system cell cycle response regulator CtrA
MLKSEGFNVYTTDLGEEGIDLGKLYDYDIICSTSTCRTCTAMTC